MSRRITNQNPQLLARLNATTLFLQELVNRPRQVGAILPSSKNLAKAMARWLPKEPGDYALELGPGTGSVTEALLERGLPEEHLIAIEQSPKMAELRAWVFPRQHHHRRRFSTGQPQVFPCPRVAGLSAWFSPACLPQLSCTPTISPENLCCRSGEAIRQLPPRRRKWARPFPLYRLALDLAEPSACRVARLPK